MRIKTCLIDHGAAIGIAYELRGKRKAMSLRLPGIYLYFSDKLWQYRHRISQ